MSVPVAWVEMASRGGAPGSISLDLAPDAAWELHTGAVLISEIDPRFVSQSKERLGHNLRNVANVLSRVGRPSGFEGPADFTAFEVFCGYLVFDAWVANRDRHEENWSVLRGPDGTVTLAASYDHGSSLAFGLTDERRSKLLGDELGVERWAAKGTAWRFEGCRSVPLVDFAVDALGMVRPKARDFWIAQLGTVSRDQAEAVVFATPEMSEVASRFCVRLLDVNRRRLLDAK